MLIGPIIFCSIVVGIGQHQDFKKVGRIGLKALIYFEIVTTFALVMAMGLAHWFKPGHNLAIAHNATSMTVASAQYSAESKSIYQELLNMLPKSVLEPFVDGNLIFRKFKVSSHNTI